MGHSLSDRGDTLVKGKEKGRAHFTGGIGIAGSLFYSGFIVPGADARGTVTGDPDVGVILDNFSVPDYRVEACAMEIVREKTRYHLRFGLN